LNSDSGGTQDMLFRSTASAALRKFAIYCDSRNTMHTVMFGFCCYFGLAHVMDNNVARPTGQAPHERNGFIAHSASSAEDFHFFFVGCHFISP
jgi:hypothetical protein